MSDVAHPSRTALAPANTCKYKVYTSRTKKPELSKHALNSALTALTERVEHCHPGNIKHIFLLSRQAR